jgi:hypothetical protein
MLQCATVEEPEPARALPKRPIDRQREIDIDIDRQREIDRSEYV